MPRSSLVYWGYFWRININAEPIYRQLHCQGDHLQRQWRKSLGMKQKRFVISVLSLFILTLQLTWGTQVERFTQHVRGKKRNWLFLLRKLCLPNAFKLPRLILKIYFTTLGKNTNMLRIFLGGNKYDEFSVTLIRLNEQAEGALWSKKSKSK